MFAKNYQLVFEVSNSYLPWPLPPGPGSPHPLGSLGPQGTQVSCWVSIQPEYSNNTASQQEACIGSFLPFDGTGHGKCLGSSREENEKKKKSICVSPQIQTLSSVFFSLKEIAQMFTFLSFIGSFLRQNCHYVPQVLHRLLCFVTGSYIAQAGLKLNIQLLLASYY